MKLIVPILALALVAPVAFAQPPEDDAAADPFADVIAKGASAPTAADGKVAFVTDPEVRLDGPRTETDASYENRVLGAYRVTQGGQGSLDGSWHVLGSDGIALYTLQITDPGAGEGRIEGAWRNLKVTGPGGSGFIEEVRREGDEVIFAFHDGPDALPAQLRLKPQPNGGWSGMTVIGETQLGVLANRAQGLETASMAVPEWRNPPPPRVKAKPKRKAKAKPKRNRRQ